MRSNPLMLAIGFSIWLVAFAALYAVQALGCVWIWPEMLHRLVLICIWLATLTVLGIVLFRQLADVTFKDLAAVDQVAALATVASILATLLTFAPTLFLSICV